METVHTEPPTENMTEEPVLHSPDLSLVEQAPPKSFTRGDPNPLEIDSDDLSPVEEVRLTVPITDDPTIPVWTFRMWFLGILSWVVLSFLNQFFSYRKEPLVITQITVQVASLPIGRFLASALPTRTFHIPGFGSRQFSLNPGPFKHVLITIFANAGALSAMVQLMLLVSLISSRLYKEYLFLHSLASYHYYSGFRLLL